MASDDTPARAVVLRVWGSTPAQGPTVPSRLENARQASHTLEPESLSAPQRSVVSSGVLMTHAPYVPASPFTPTVEIVAAIEVRRTAVCLSVPPPALQLEVDWHRLARLHLSCRT